MDDLVRVQVIGLGKPDPPTNLSVVTNGNDFDVSWTNPADFDTIELDKINANGTYTNEFSGVGTSHTITNSHFDIGYQVRLRSVRNGLGSDYVYDWHSNLNFVEYEPDSNWDSTVTLTSQHLRLLSGTNKFVGMFSDNDVITPALNNIVRMNLRSVGGDDSLDGVHFQSGPSSPSSFRPSALDMPTSFAQQDITRTQSLPAGTFIHTGLWDPSSSGGTTHDFEIRYIEYL